MWFQNGASTHCEFDPKSQVWSQTRIARQEVQLSLNYIYFESAKFSRSDTWFSSLYKYLLEWSNTNAGLLKVSKVVFQFPAIRLVTLNNLWNLIGCCAWVKLSHWLKRWNSEQKILWFVNKSHCWEPIRLQRSPVISKWM